MEDNKKDEWQKEDLSQNTSEKIIRNEADGQSEERNNMAQGVYSSQRYEYSSQNPRPIFASESAAESKNQKKKGSFLGKVFAALILGILFGAMAGGSFYAVNYFAKVADNSLGSNVKEEANIPQTNDINMEIGKENDGVATVVSRAIDVSDVVEEVMPSVVAIEGLYTVTSQGFFGQVYRQQTPGSGSGIIIANDGEKLLIATNNHVVENSDELSVQFINGKVASANIKGANPSNDLAVIEVDLRDIDAETKESIKVAKLGNSDDLKVGSTAIAIGNSLGYGQTVTTGVISALDRKLQVDTGETYEGLIQTDAAINPGNSGGALLNIYGQVIGINSSKIGGTSIDGVGFAIPISAAEPILSDIVTNASRTKISENRRGYLGIGGVSVTAEASQMYGMPIGIQVRQIYEGTGAAETNLQPGDIISIINGLTVESMEELQEELSYHEAGETVDLSVYRFENGQYIELEIQLVLSSRAQLEG